MDLFREIALVFLEDRPNQLARIDSAIQSSDAEALRSSAHSLKGAVGNFGADAARKNALLLEEIGKEGRLEDAVAVYDELKNNVKQLDTFLFSSKLSLMVSMPLRPSSSVWRRTSRSPATSRA